MLDGDTAVLAEEMVNCKYQSWQGGVVHTIAAGYDGAGPMDLGRPPGLPRDPRQDHGRLRPRPRWSSAPMATSSGGTTRKRFRARLPRGTRRVSVRATDLAGNLGGRGARLPRC